ncbi:RmlC-like cupin [Aspergillus granulosus]|uniref:RmlC-like cupin n=1 Tax=Aspergillus granulosus TaxID=176169 RepID=A0ABR4GWM7_9EURO
MSLWTNTPPDARVPYAIPQLEGERITIPGSKGAFRILASSKQTNGLMAVFQSGAVLSDAPGFHYHNHAHDVFLVTKGYLKLWNGDKCRIMGPGDFAYVPPGIVHNPELLGPHTETFGLITPGDWIDFFRYVAEPYEGILVPETDNRDLKSILIPKVMAAKEKFDVVFQPNYVPPELGEWDKDDERLPEGQAPFFLRANTGPRWMLGGVLSRPFITTAQSNGVCAISSIESSSIYNEEGGSVLSRVMTFASVDHCLAVQEGTLGVVLKGQEEVAIREGETVVIPAGQAFSLHFRSRFVRVWSFTDGNGIESLVQRAGQAFAGVVLPETVGGWDTAVVRDVAKELGVEIELEEPPRSKRPRAAQACDRCRLKKYKCDELYPCSQCKKSQLKCVYQGNYRQLENSRSASYVLDLEKRVEELNSKLRAAECKLSAFPAHPTLDATPHSMPVDRPMPTPRTDLEEPPLPCYNSNIAPDAETNPGPDAGADETSDPVEEEISELNHHTNGIEFHGSTSSVAFLGHLQKTREPPRTEDCAHSRSRAQGYSIVSTLHNAGFSPTNSAAQAQQSLSIAAVHEHNYYFDHAHVFMSGYFENIHFVHPFIDKEDFYLRAQDLWLRRTPTPDPSFVALYLSVLSFGALLRVWDEAQLGGLTRFEWSRKLFGEAQLYLNHLHFPNNLDAVQCLYLMAKICQNELNPNLAYMYLGLAIRTCLAAGFNRKVRHADPRADWISRTWWGLFSLEIEMSFSLGRPDTLGMDEYHNRPLPPRDNTQYAIIPWMVDFAQIIRRVSVQIYHRRMPLFEKLHVALAIEAELDGWMARLPGWIRPDFVDSDPSGEGGSEHQGDGGRNALRDPKWARRQRVVLGIRYYNVKMLLFRPFLSHYTRRKQNRPLEQRQAQRLSMQNHSPLGEPGEMDETPSTSTSTSDILITQTIRKCLDAAERTIAVMHDIYRRHTFFRCWWYNTTYITFATSTLLLPLSRPGFNLDLDLDLSQQDDTTYTSTRAELQHNRLSSFRNSIRKAIDILEATDESVVARKSAEIIRHYLREFEERDCRAGGGGGGGGSSSYGNGTGEQMMDPSPSSSSGPYTSGADDVFGAAVYGPVPGEGGDGLGIPEWAYGFGFSDCSFEGVARFFDDLGGISVLDE